jgi:type VI secretion system protein ImpA
MIDIQACTAPIPGDNPAGADLRYTPVYDAIKEARKAEDQLARGAWEREVKTSDWDTVISISADALATKSKDLQIAAWLTEALVRTEGFKGLASGLSVINGLLEQYWDSLYPLVEDGDLEYRAGCFEFLNDKLATPVRDVPVTDPKRTNGYSWLAWQDSRRVGTEKDVLNQYGDVDEGKKQARDALIAEGKVPAEEFDSAVAQTSKAFYEEISGLLASSLDEFGKMDAMVDEKFGREAPRLSDLKAALEECSQLVERILKEKRKQEPDAAPVKGPEKGGANLGETGDAAVAAAAPGRQAPAGGAGVDAGIIPAFYVQDQTAVEEALWDDALETVSRTGIMDALEKLKKAAISAPSVRQNNRYMLLIAKLCLKVNRPDLARPVIEQLYNLVTELNLEKWESPTWIADIIDAYYQCLTVESSSDEDKYRARTELFQKLCTRDITKAAVYKG